MTDTAAEDKGAESVYLIPDAQKAHTKAPSPTKFILALACCINCISL